MEGFVIVIPLLLSMVTAQDSRGVNGSYDKALYTNNPEGIEIGLMQPFRDPPKIEKAVWFIEEDRTQNKHFIIADGSALKIFNYNFNPLQLKSIAGDSMSEGYREGTYTNARFNTITGFTQVNATHILVVDSNNHCLRYVERREGSSVTSSYAGLCGTPGLVNGPASNTRFNLPRQIVLTRKKNKGVAFVTDFGNSAIRRIVIKNDMVETWITLPRAPIAIILDLNEFWIFATTTTQVLKVHPYTNRTSPVMQSSTPGFQDGDLESAQINFPTSILELTKFTFLITEPSSNRLRVIDTDAKNVTSICNGNGAFTNSSTDIENCELEQPLFIVEARELVIIGTNGTEMRLLDFSRRLAGRPPFVNQRPELLSETTTATLPLTGEGKQAKDNSTTIAITVAVVGTVIVSLLVIASIVFYRFKKAKKANQSKSHSSATQHSTPNKPGVHPTLSAVSGEYAEIQERYESLKDVELKSGYTHIELEKDQPAIHPRSVRYSPLPKRPFQAVNSNTDSSPDYVDGEIMPSKAEDADSMEVSCNGYIEFNSQECLHEKVKVQVTNQTGKVSISTPT